MASGGTLPTKTGKFTADGAARTIETVGFRPKSLRFINQTTGAIAEWTDTMPDAAVVTHDSGTDAVDTAQGVTPTDTGFSIGTNAVINTDGDIVHFEALG